MAIEFTDVDYQRVEFPSVAVFEDLATKTIVFRIDIQGLGGGAHAYEIINKVAALAGWDIYVGTSTGVIYFLQSFDGDGGIWRTGAGSIAPGSYDVAITYDLGAVGNNPIIYLDGVPVAVTEVVAPVGAAVSDAGISIRIGSHVAGAYSIDGSESNVRIYNRILTPAEVLAIYEGRGRDNIINGLVFAPVLYGASGLQAYDGVVLGSGNKLVDPYSGAYGTPSGSPIGRAETYLSICP
jgi:hypothetical protein